MSSVKRQRRSRVACIPCRDRKRKCDGNQLCETCREFGYACHYDTSIRKKRNKNLFLGSPAQPHQPEVPLNDTQPQPAHSPDHRPASPQPQSLESNSGAAFVRNLGLKIDPANAPEPQLFAWNIGARQLPGTFAALNIADIVSQDELLKLARVYFDKVDPYYGFIDQDTFFEYLDSRWSRQGTPEPYDAVLCGVAAMGYLFSQNKATPAELHLVESARVALEQFSMSGIPPLTIISGWALRLAYLRLTATPHTAWMASCSLLHLLEASGLHLETKSKHLLFARPQKVDTNIRRRLFGFVQYINTWISFDLGRSRVILLGASYNAPTRREGDYTVEMLNLLPLSENLEPNVSLEPAQLKATFFNILDNLGTQHPLVLSQCNLVLCIFRRLRELRSGMCAELEEQLLTLMTKSLACARNLASENCPWSHVANVPFQIVCTLLSMDTPASLSRLTEAMDTLKIVMEIYDTDVMKEAYRTAGLLILLQQRRKEKDARSLNNVLEKHSTAPPDPNIEFLNEGVLDAHNSDYFGDLMAEIPSLDSLDFAHIFMADYHGLAVSDMISSIEYNYSYFRISKTENLLDSAHRYKEQRLQALKLSPSSFASSYELESTFPDEYWISRLTQPERETFICAATPIPQSDDADHSEPEWVAQVTFLGPQSKERFALSESELANTNTSEDEIEERWQMLGLFNHSAHRGKGIAKALTRTALEYLIARRCQPNNVIVRLMVKPGMQATIEFYRQLGFVEVGRCTLATALIANGDRELLPEGYERQEKYTACTSHVMKQRVWRNANKT